MTDSRGMTLIETLMVTALAGMMLAVAVPALASLREQGRTAAGARVLAMELHRMRWESVARRRAAGLWFARGPAGWEWHLVEDGNGNGLRTAEIAWTSTVRFYAKACAATIARTSLLMRRSLRDT